MRTFILLFLLIQVAACVSLEVGRPETHRSKRYTYQIPEPPFYKIKDKAVDVVWISKTTGATLSIKSRCQTYIKLDLKDWSNRISAGLDESEVISFKDLQLYNRKAIQVIIRSSFEGFDNRLILTSFVKNSCHYVIALTALSQSFIENQQVYENFLAGFKAW